LQLSSAVIIESLTDVGTVLSGAHNISENDPMNRVLALGSYDGAAVLVGLRITLPARLSVLTGTPGDSVPGAWEQAQVAAVLRDRISAMLDSEDAFNAAFFLFSQSWQAATQNALDYTVMDVAYSAYVEARAADGSIIALPSATPQPTASPLPSTGATGGGPGGNPGGGPGGNPGGNNQGGAGATESPTNVGIIVGPVVAGVVVLGALGVLAWAYTAGPLAHHRRAGVVDDGSVEGHHDGEEEGHEGSEAAPAAAAPASRRHDSHDEEAAHDGDDAHSAGTGHDDHNDHHDHDDHHDAHSEAHTSEHDDHHSDAAGADINVEVHGRVHDGDGEGTDGEEEAAAASSRRMKGRGKSSGRIQLD
jgi:hypothetical protein